MNNPFEMVVWVAAFWSAVRVLGMLLAHGRHEMKHREELARIKKAETDAVMRAALEPEDTDPGFGVRVRGMFRRK